MLIIPYMIEIENITGTLKSGKLYAKVNRHYRDNFVNESVKGIFETLGFLKVYELSSVKVINYKNKTYTASVSMRSKAQPEIINKYLLRFKEC